MTLIPRVLSSDIALIRNLPRAARVATGLFFLAGLADGVLMPFFALWAHREGGIATGTIGLLLGCYAGGELLATPLVGGIADRLGRRRVLLASTMGIGVGFLLLHWSHGVVAAAACLLLIGAFESVLHPTAATVIADVVPAGQIRQHYALTRMASNAGSVVGPALGAFVALQSLSLVFVVSGAAMLLGALLVLTLLPETAGSEADEDDDDASALAALHDRRLAALLMPVAALGIASSWIEAILPLYAADAGTLAPTGVGLLFSWAGLLGVMFQLPVVRATARVTGAVIVAASGSTLVLAFGALLVSPALPSLLGAVTLVAFAEMLSGPLTQGIVTELAPKQARATYMAAFSSVQDVRDAAGPAIGTALYAASATLPWLAGVPVTLAASLALALAARRHEARLE